MDLFKSVANNQWNWIKSYNCYKSERRKKECSTGKWRRVFFYIAWSDFVDDFFLFLFQYLSLFLSVTNLWHKKSASVVHEQREKSMNLFKRCKIICSQIELHGRQQKWIIERLKKIASCCASTSGVVVMTESALN